MTRYASRRIAPLAVGLAMTLAMAAPAAAQWSDRTTITFSAPVRVPGTTLQPGTYVFELIDPDSTLNVVTIRDREGKVHSLTHAVPAKQLDPTEDVILLFSPTKSGSMPAIRGWFPAGGRHGYHFVYDNDEARQITERTKTIVLSRNIADTREEAGSIVIVDPAGPVTVWRQDPEVQREWDEWRISSRAPMVADAVQAPRVELDDLEDSPEEYMDRTVSVDGEIDEVLGPHIFVVEESGWGAKEGEVLVLVPAGLIAPVREDDHVTIIGKVKKFDRADVVRESTWLDIDDDLEGELEKKPVLVASRIAGGDNDRAVVMDVANPNGVTTAVLSDAKTLGQANATLVGRRVNVARLQVTSVDDKGGFFARAEGVPVFVLMKDEDAFVARPGDLVTVTGVILELPRELAARLNPPAGANTIVYVYADRVNK